MASIKAFYVKERVVTEPGNDARELNNTQCFGSVLDDGSVELSLIEALYLLEKDRISILEGEVVMEKADYIKKAVEREADFWTRYCVYKDMRSRGYVVKTALKFGADFRVYDRGVKPGEDHAKWIIYPVRETESTTWYEFAAKNRVAHSTKKRLMIGIVDDESDVTYYEIKWTRP